jgi:release factor glutamine methyltransferase
VNIKKALIHGDSSLQKTSPSPRIDAEMLLLFVLQSTRTHLYTHPEALLTPEQWQQYQYLISQRSLGHPIAHLTQSKEFWSLPLRVTPDTLIPRPETELLIELTLMLLGTIDDAHILDLGTGTGAIALALASERPTWHIEAYDQSNAALQVARQNALDLKLTQIEFGQSNWFQSIPMKAYHAIISNPPYIAEHDNHLEQGDVRFEPQQALTSGREGLDALTEIIKTGIHYLRPGGLLLVEHGYDQKNAVAALFAQFGYKDVQSFKDFEGNDRVTGGFVLD